MCCSDELNNVNVSKNQGLFVAETAFSDSLVLA